MAARDLADDPDAVELKKYLGNFYARAGYSLESCEESNQGKVYVEELWPVVCDKGSWMFDDEMPHEMGTMVNSRDGKVYKTTTFELNGVKQTWMAENLNYSDSLQGDSWCYDNDPKNCETYGRLYSWNAAMNTREPLDYESLRCAEEDVDFYNHEDEIADSLLDSQGICPDGWRLPTKEDWSVILTDRSSMFNLESYRRCAYIRSKSWTSELFILASSDMFGFSSLPAGYSKIDYVDEEAAAAYYDGEIDEEPAKGRIFKAEGLEAYFGIFGYDYVWLFGNNSYFKKRMWRADDVAVSIRCIKND